MVSQLAEKLDQRGVPDNFFANPLESFDATKDCIFHDLLGKLSFTALLLCDSLSKAEPNAGLHLFLADRLPDADWPGALDDRIVFVGIDKLAIDDLDDMTFRYSILELNTAIKPFCFDYLFDVLGFEANPDVAHSGDPAQLAPSATEPAVNHQTNSVYESGVNDVT